MGPAFVFFRRLGDYGDQCGFCCGYIVVIWREMLFFALYFKGYVFVVFIVTFYCIAIFLYDLHPNYEEVV